MTPDTRPRAALAALLALAGLAACAPATPAPGPVGEPVSASPTDRLLAAIEAEGCVLTSANTGAVLLRANLRQADLPQLFSALAADGRVEDPGNGTLRVLTDNCI